VPPSFCRHNRFIANCPICRQPDPPPGARRSSGSAASKRSAPSRPAASSRSRSAVRVRKLSQAADDGYRDELVPGLRASADAGRLAAEIAFAAARLAELAADPPELYAQIGAEPAVEEALWLAFLTAYLTPTEDEDPFAGIRAAHVPWSGGELPDLGVALGMRTSHDRAAGERTVLAYRAWAQRAGGQQAAFEGEASWTPERRFDRLFERLALPGFGRPGRYDLLVTLGRLGVVDVRASTLELGDDATTIAAKRVFGIGDKMLLERRARDLADAVEVPIEALDLALFNWAAPQRGRATMGSAAVASEDERSAIAGVLGV
jgi:alpha-glutamyl/putrescinyl thymine pyrophosphorylase-like protein